MKDSLRIKLFRDYLGTKLSCGSVISVPFFAEKGLKDFENCMADSRYTTGLLKSLNWLAGFQDSDMHVNDLIGLVEIELETQEANYHISGSGDADALILILSNYSKFFKLYKEDEGPRNHPSVYLEKLEAIGYLAGLYWILGKI